MKLAELHYEILEALEVYESPKGVARLLDIPLEYVYTVIEETGYDLQVEPLNTFR